MTLLVAGPERPRRKVIGRSESARKRLAFVPKTEQQGGPVYAGDWRKSLLNGPLLRCDYLLSLWVSRGGNCSRSRFVVTKSVQPGRQVVAQNAEDDLGHQLFANRDLAAPGKPELHGGNIIRRFLAALSGCFLPRQTSSVAPLCAYRDAVGSRRRKLWDQTRVVDQGRLLLEFLQQ